MAKGIRVRRADGSIALDSTTPITFVLGAVTTGAGINGSLTIPDAGAEKYFAYITGVVSDATAPSGGAYGVDGASLPAVTVNGRTLTWQFPDGEAPASQRPNVIITYAGYSL